MTQRSYIVELDGVAQGNRSSALENFEEMRSNSRAVRPMAAGIAAVVTEMLEVAKDDAWRW
jgi:hypothetical protein